MTGKKQAINERNNQQFNNIKWVYYLFFLILVILLFPNLLQLNYHFLVKIVVYILILLLKLIIPLVALVDYLNKFIFWIVYILMLLV